jgi:hypothetical protein
MRLRTTTTDTNGRPSKTSAVGTATTALTHLVYTRNSSGFVKLYINGVEQLNSTVGGNFSNWSDAYRLMLGNELSGDRPWLGTASGRHLRPCLRGSRCRYQAYAQVLVIYWSPLRTAGRLIPAPAMVTPLEAYPRTAFRSHVMTAPAPRSTQPVTINVLSNDSGLEDTPVTVSVISGPSNGSTSVKSDSSIVYTPASGFYGSDSFTYRVMDANGDMATAAVTIPSPAPLATYRPIINLTLTWDAVPGEILGYRVYYGNTATNATTFASVTPTNSATYLSVDDLGLKAGDSVCFRVKAYNNAGESSYSSAVCKVI